MSHKIILLGIALLIILGVSVELLSNKERSFDGLAKITQDNILEDLETNAKNCISDECLLVDDLSYPVGSLPKEVVDALNLAIQDEYKAHSTYVEVNNSLGTVKPFSMIVRAEENHITALKALYDKYGVSIPDNMSNVSIIKPRTLQQACEIAVAAEQANVALYQDSLLPLASDYPDISSVFTSLMEASQTRHLPAFEKCAGL